MIFKKLVRLNAAFIIETLQKLIPGSPKLAFLLFHNGGIKMASITVPDTSAPLSAAVKFLDAEGFETTADDVPAWSSSDSTVADVTAAADGLSAEVAIGGPGVALISVSTTNDDGSTAEAQGTITVQPGDAVIGDVSFEAPTP